MTKNLSYKRGADKERAIVKEARDKGLIAFRSAGSHSPIDLCIIDVENKKIELIQCKSTKGMPRSYIDPRLKEKLINEWSYINGTYKVSFDAK